MKPSQILNRVKIRAGGKCPLKTRPISTGKIAVPLRKIPCLDFSVPFLERFSAERLLKNEVSLLHSTEAMDWSASWSFSNRSALWNYNLHYFEYLFPLLRAWQNTGERKYLDKTIEMISGWISAPLSVTKPGRAAYPTAIRMVSWITWYGYVEHALDEEFKAVFLNSLFEQYSFLSEHLEKDILGNHYYEDLKALVIASLFFDEEAMLSETLECFRNECREQILPDGVHYERSPMYHNLILEGLLRVVISLRGRNRQDQELELYAKRMMDAAWSLQSGLDRIPLFHDCGNNVSKPLSALVECGRRYLSIVPQTRSVFPCGGYVRLEYGQWTLLVDASAPGPDYQPGHAHSEAMSFELFCNGKPVIVNCGTFAYQCEERVFFRSTLAHNTVMADHEEQSACWSVFRVGARARVSVLEADPSCLRMQMTDQKGTVVERCMAFRPEKQCLLICDEAQGHFLESAVHGAVSRCSSESKCEELSVPYAVDYGQTEQIPALVFSGRDRVEIKIDLKEPEVL